MTVQVLLKKLSGLVAAQKDLLEKLAALALEMDNLLGGSGGIAAQLRDFEEAWDLTWCRRYAPGEQKRYVWNFARDRAHLKRLLPRLGSDELLRRAQVYLLSDDPFYLKNRHPFGLFIAGINSFAAAPQSSAQPVLGCSHEPPCPTETAHTRRRMAEVRA